MDELEDPLRLREVLQPVVAQVTESRALGQALPGELGDERREQDLASVPGRHDPGRAIHGRAVVVAAPWLGLAGVHPDADPERPGLAPRLRGQHPLCLETRLYTIRSGWEDGHETVAHHLDDAPLGALDRVGEDRVVTLHRRLHRVREPLPEPRARLEVGKDEREGLGR